MVKMPPTIILLHHGEVPVCVVLLFPRGSSSLILLSVKSSLELLANFLTFFLLIELSSLLSCDMSL
jgi:hypothetical protein